MAALRIGGATVSRADGDLLDLRLVHAGGALPELFAHLERAEVQLADIEVRRPTLDDVFLSLTGRALRDEPETIAA